jgi:hypothetical protein
MARKRSSKRKKRPASSTTVASPLEASDELARNSKILPAFPLYLAGLLAFWSFGYTTMRGSDFWWHLASGRWMLEHRSVPRTDFWSYTHWGQPWMHHEWLSDVLYAAWEKLLGMESLVWWKWCVIVATFLLLMRCLHRLARCPLAALLAAGFALAVAAPFLDIRPHLYSLLGYVLVLRLALIRERPAPLLPLIFLVWVNLHGGFFFGLMALSIALFAWVLFPEAVGNSGAAASSAEPAKRRWAYAVALGLACAGICLINPNFAEPFVYPLRYAFSATSPYRSLNEWKPPFESGGIAAPLFPYALGVIGVAVLWLLISGRWRSRRRESLAGLLLSTLTLLMALESRRFIPLFAISGSLLLAPALAALFAALESRLRPPLEQKLGPLPTRLLVSVAALIAGALLLAPYPQSNRAFLYLTAEDTFPVETLNFVEANGIAGRTFAYYNWGGYIHLRLDGQLQVYIDGRADTVFDDETFRRYMHIISAGEGAVYMVEASGADWVLWPRNSERLIEQLLQSGRWYPLFEDAVSILFRHEDSPVPESLRETGDSAYRELRLADRARRLDDLDGAEQHYRRALDLMPHLGKACHPLARMQVMRGEFDDGRAIERRCQRSFPHPEWSRHIEDLIAEQTRLRR